MQMPEKLEIDDNSYSNNYGKFVLQPLEKGFGATLGNSLRRVLLSSISGTAFTALKVNNLLHEFSTIPGIKEDLSEIILNLKMVRMKSLDKKADNVTIKIKGSKVVTAGDIQKVTDEIEIMNPTQHIATLESGAELDLELFIGSGKGFVPAEENVQSDNIIGVIPIDSIFSPIVNVKYAVEPTRVGQQTDFEKLVLEVQTDGSITPDDAITQAARILQDHIHLFTKFETETASSLEITESDAEVIRIREILRIPVEELELSVRSHNVLRSGNIITLGDLVKRDISDLLQFRNFGRKSLSELTEIVEEYGLTFGMDVNKYLEG